jgi:hypothetical protein
LQYSAQLQYLQLKKKKEGPIKWADLFWSAQYRCPTQLSGQPNPSADPLGQPKRPNFQFKKKKEKKKGVFKWADPIQFY